MPPYQIYLAVFAIVPPILELRGYQFLFPSVGSGAPRALLVNATGHVIKEVAKTELSFCLWVHIDNAPEDIELALVSFASKETGKNNEILLELKYGKINYTYISVNNIRKTIQAAPPLYQWAHLCCMWESETSEGELYIDGEYTARVSGLYPQNIGGEGYMILGQDQDDPNGGFEAENGFKGKMTQFHLWNRAISEYEVVQVKNCELQGNVVNWDNATWALFDNVVMILSDVPCRDDDWEVKRCPANASLASPLDVHTTDQNQTNTTTFMSNGFKKMAVISGFYEKPMKDVKTLSMCAWVFSNFLPVTMHIFVPLRPTLFSALISAPNAQDVHSHFLVDTDPFGKVRFYMNANGTKITWVVPDLQMFHRGWHHFCFTWSSKREEVEVFFNGNFVAANSELPAGVVFPNLNFELLQLQVGLIRDSSFPHFVVWKLVDFNVWDRLLSRKEVSSVYCNSSLEGNVINWKTDQVKIIPWTKRERVMDQVKRQQAT